MLDAERETESGGIVLDQVDLVSQARARMEAWNAAPRGRRRTRRVLKRGGQVLYLSLGGTVELCGHGVSPSG
ncbi:hypothetical protein ABT294_25845 [Nonomuraea sp. NPDC000554]|uniref:hypothetical protein n=1 Tax=Nonomuraea sp. NPDC000554 TaxID=3154259 RepID=UPI00332C4FA8